jgi:hypothetical protein
MTGLAMMEDMDIAIELMVELAPELVELELLVVCICRANRQQ